MSVAIMGVIQAIAFSAVVVCFVMFMIKGRSPIGEFVMWIAIAISLIAAAAALKLA